MILFLIFAVDSLAQMPPERVKWELSPAAFAGKVVEVSLMDGSRLRGAWTQVSPTTFSMALDGKGLQVYQREDIRKVKTGERRIRGRVIGVLAGFYSVAAIAFAATGSGEGLQGMGGIVSVGGGVAGYYVGKSLDRQTREVVLLP